MECFVTEDGRIRGCRSRGGPEELFRVARSHAEDNWRCSPAENAEGQRVAARYTFRIPFNLEG
ncbi:MAG: hypothetical protein ACJAYU_000430 [Bradymonadia bacterium]|jgi:hypothetical protein